MSEKFILCGGGNTPYIEASSWNVISQASPTAISLNPATLAAFSNSDNSYDSATAGFKTILFFNNGLSAGKYLLMPWQMPDGSSHLTGFYSGNVTSNHATERSFARVRPHTALWAPAAIDWNNFFAAGPTHGAALEQEYTADAQWDNAVSTVLGLAITGVGRLAPIVLTTAVTVFGFSIDCKPGLPTNFTSRTLSSAGLSATVPTGSGGTNKHIYAVRMAA